LIQESTIKNLSLFPTLDETRASSPTGTWRPLLAAFGLFLFRKGRAWLASTWQGWEKRHPDVIAWSAVAARRSEPAANR
jgi:hypothetical protein